MLQRIESENEDLKRAVNGLEGEKSSNMQRVKLLEHELNKIKKLENNSSEKDAYLVKLQSECEELKLTNTVYFEQIGELIDKNNSLEDQLEKYASAQHSIVDRNRREAKEGHGFGDNKSVNQGSLENTTVKASVIRNSSAQTDDINVLRKENEGLKHKIVDLTDKNMEMQNKLHEMIRGKSQSKTSKK